MAEQVEFSFSLKDLFTGQLKKAQAEGKKSFDALDKEADEFSNKVKQAGASTSTLGTTLSGLKGLIAGAFAGLAIGSAIKSMATLSIEAEQNKIAFTTFLGSVDAANESLKGLKQFASVTPFSSKEVIDVGKALLGFGVQAKDLTPTLKSIGDLSAGTGKNFKELAVIFGQIKSVGKLMGGDLMQLRQSGIPIVAELAKNYGTTEAAITEMVTKGKIGFKDVEKAFTSLTSEGGMFFDLMAKQSLSLGGQLSTLQDNLEVIGTEIGDNFIAPVIAGFVKFVNGFLDNIAPVKAAFASLFQAFAPIGQAINELGIAFGLWNKTGIDGANVATGFANIITTYVTPAVAILANTFKFISDVITSNMTLIKVLTGLYVLYNIPVVVATVATTAWTAAQWLLNAALTANPIGLVVAGIALLIAGITYAWKKVDGFKETILGLWEGAKYAFTNMGTFIPKVLQNIGKFFGDTFQPFFEAIDAFKRGDYAEAAKKAGVGLLKVATIAPRLAIETVNGNLFKGTGADDAFKKEYDRVKKEKADNLEKEAFKEAIKSTTATTAAITAAITPLANPLTVNNALKNNQTAATAKETAQRGGSGPASVTVNLTFNKDSFHYDVNSVAESQQSVEAEFARIIANVANLTTRAIR
jgi:tape measure domain-containing protein